MFSPPVSVSWLQPVARSNRVALSTRSPPTPPTAGDVWQALHWFSLKAGPRPSAGRKTRLNTSAPARKRSRSTGPRPGSGAPGSPVAAARPPQPAAPTTASSQRSRTLVTPAAGPDDDYSALRRGARPAESDRHLRGPAVYLDGLDLLGLDQVVECDLGALRSRKRCLGGRRKARQAEPPCSCGATNDHDPVHEHARMAPAAMGEEGAVQLDAGAAKPTRSWYDAHAGNAGQQVGDPLWSAALDLLPGDEMTEIGSLPFVKADTDKEGVR